MRKNKKGHLIMLANSQSIDGVPEVVKLIPLGSIKSQKGDFEVDVESYKAMCNKFAGRGIDIVIDYEHQTLKDVQAPAGGWIKELILSDDSICGRVEWTPKAAEYLKNKEYRYLSPVVLVRESDHKALVLTSVALTNTPAIDNMFPIINSLNFYDEGEKTMDEFLKKLAALLGLGETATEDDITAAINKLKENGKTEVVANKMVLSLLSLKDDATTAEVTAKIAGLQNPANFVPVEQYNLIANKLNEQEGTGLVELALKEGKITPAQKEWADNYVKADKAGFEQFVKMAVPVVPMQEYQLKADVKQNGTAVDPTISKMMGLSAEDIEKYGKGVK